MPVTPTEYCDGWNFYAKRDIEAWLNSGEPVFEVVNKEGGVIATKSRSEVMADISPRLETIASRPCRLPLQSQDSGRQY